jgi:hypothetical protein
MPVDLFEWSCQTVADVIRDVAADPPPEAPSLLDRVAPEGGTRRR